RFRPKDLKLDDAAFAKLPGLTIHDVMLLPLDRALEFFQGLRGNWCKNWCQTPFSEEGPRTSDDGGRKWCLAPIFAPSPAPISAPLSAATELVLDAILTRLGYLNEVGLGYLTLDRQSRTLSGGEVQRINLTTALGTSLVNTLFVLDEPSIGLHA